ncbi:hypothetical protein HAX54_026772 [Datura stramonium]|uniref:Uncharacterized protein n=1 Tax=Datura stramonium TaxID=4076 RepID=A0ABS8V3P9_DATST|nr:hypothetical protein [Datura stramonium]
MRIRKHARNSHLIYTHICQLNQSTWDVITFPVEENDDPSLVPPPSSSSSSNYQFDGYTHNYNFFDSNETVQSNVADDVDISVDVKKIKQEDVEMEELGLLLDENDNGNNSTNKKLDKQHEAAETGSPRHRPARAKKSSSSYDPYEFYYYSGFGPLWGKKRGARRTISDNNSIAEDADQYSSSQVEDNEEFDYVQLEVEDDHEEIGKKKRPRKPIKARSLKSLM